MRRNGGPLTLLVVENNNGDNDSDDNQKDDKETETYPPLLASPSSRSDCMDGVTQPCFRIFLDMARSLLDLIDRFVLLLDQNTHLHVGVRMITVARGTIDVHR